MSVRNLTRAEHYELAEAWSYRVKNRLVDGDNTTPSYVVQAEVALAQVHATLAAVSDTVAEDARARWETGRSLTLKDEVYR